MMMMMKIKNPNEKEIVFILIELRENFDRVYFFLVCNL